MKYKYKRIPMMRELRDMMSLQLYASTDALIKQPSLDQFQAVAQIVNVVALTIDDDKRFSTERLHISSGIAAMMQISRKCETGLKLRDDEVASINLMVSTIDRILSRLDVSKLYLSMRKLNG